MSRWIRSALLSCLLCWTLSVSGLHASETRAFVGIGNFNATYREGEEESAFQGQMYTGALYHRLNSGFSLGIQSLLQAGSFERQGQTLTYERQALVPSVGAGIKIFSTLLNPRVTFTLEGQVRGYEIPIFFDYDSGWFWGLQYGAYDHETDLGSGQVSVNNATFLLIGFTFRHTPSPAASAGPNAAAPVDDDVLINVYPTIYDQPNAQ
jgi:hypothetical protein